MSVRAESIHELAIYAPKLAFGLIIGVPRVPFVAELPLQFSSSAVNAPPVVVNLLNNLTQDTVIERISYNLSQPNSFPGSPFQSTYFNQLKQSGATGIGVQLQVYGGPKYVVSDSFVDLGTLADVLAFAWPSGGPLPKQSNVKVSAVLTETPVSVPFNATITLLGWQLLDKTVDDLSDAQARDKLRKLGIATPDLNLLLIP